VRDFLTKNFGEEKVPTGSDDDLWCNSSTRLGMVTLELRSNNYRFTQIVERIRRQSAGGFYEIAMMIRKLLGR